MCKEQSRYTIIFAFPRVCVQLLCAVPQARGPVQLGGAAGTSQLCAPDPIQCAWAPTRTAAPEAAKGNLEALKVLDITQLPQFLLQSFQSGRRCSVRWSPYGLLASFVLAEWVGYRLAGDSLLLQARVYKATQRSTGRSPSRPHHKLVLVSVCAADRGLYIWLRKWLAPIRLQTW